MTLKRVTKIWSVPNHNNNLMEDSHMIEAASFLKQGKTVAFPTETVYGLGADATNEEAVKQIFIAKGRPNDNPLIAHIGNRKTMKQYVTDVPIHAEKLMDAFWPGPITIILPSNGKLAKSVTANLSTVGMRMPDHPHALALLNLANRPIAAPSANRSGKPSPTTAEHVRHDLDGWIDGIVDGGRTGVGVESTVIDCTLQRPMILRPGGITRKEIEAIIGTVDIAQSKIDEHEQPRSPGMKYKHYAPDVPLIIIEGDANRMWQFAQKLKSEGKRVQFLISRERSEQLQMDHALILGSEKNKSEMTANLYDLLRKIDTLPVDIVLAQSFSKEGIGEALMNRLERAASDIK